MGRAGDDAEAAAGEPLPACADGAAGADPAPLASIDGALGLDGEAEVADSEGVETDGVETAGVETTGVDTDGVDTDGVDTDGTDTDGMETDGAGYTDGARSTAHGYRRHAHGWDREGTTRKRIESRKSPPRAPTCLR